MKNPHYLQLWWGQLLSHVESPAWRGKSIRRECFTSKHEIFNGCLESFKRPRKIRHGKLMYIYWYCNLTAKCIKIPQGSIRLGTMSTEHRPNNAKKINLSESNKKNNATIHVELGLSPISTSKAQKLQRHQAKIIIFWILMLRFFENNDIFQSVFWGDGPRKKLVGKSTVQKRVLTQPQLPYHGITGPSCQRPAHPGVDEAPSSWCTRRQCQLTLKKGRTV